MRQRGNRFVPERRYGVSAGNCLGVVMRALRVFQGSAGLLMTGQMFWFSVLLRHAVRVRGLIV